MTNLVLLFFGACILVVMGVLGWFSKNIEDLMRKWKRDEWTVERGE